MYLSSNFRYISKMEYIKDEYPTFCYGPLYVMNRWVMKTLFDLFAATFKENYIWIEDVYLTGTYSKNCHFLMIAVISYHFAGILPEIADIPQVDFYDYLILEPWDVVNNDSAREALLLRSPFIAAHADWMTPKERQDKWHELLDSE